MGDRAIWVTRQEFLGCEFEQKGTASLVVVTSIENSVSMSVYVEEPTTAGTGRRFLWISIGGEIGWGWGRN